jgi:hypothetical protein
VDISSGVCVICKKDTDEKLCVISLGLQTLVEQCTASGKVDVIRRIEESSDEKPSVHGSCRRKLAYIARTVNKGDKNVLKKQCVKTRGATGSFSFKDMCFLCAKPVSFGKDTRKVVSGEEFDANLRKTIDERCGDEWATVVKGRVEMVADLFAADALYHVSCYVRFTRKLPHTPNKKKRGRPLQQNARNAVDQLMAKLEAECENETYTLHDLHVMMQELLDDPSDVYTPKYLKQQLIERYGDHIYFASRPGRDDVVGFKNLCDFMIHNSHFANANDFNGTEAEQAVYKAAGLLSAAIREMQYSRDFYPSPDDISGDGLQFLPQLLQVFLQRLVKSPLKQAAIGQCMVQACRPEGCIMPLIFGLGVEVDQCGVESLHMKLARLGFALTVDEIRRYKFSVMQTPQASGSLPQHDGTANTKSIYRIALTTTLLSWLWVGV